MAPMFVPAEVDDAPMGALTTGLVGTWILDVLVLVALILVIIELVRIRVRVSRLNGQAPAKQDTGPETVTSNK